MSVHNDPSRQSSFVSADYYSSIFNQEVKSEIKEDMENQLDKQLMNGLSPKSPFDECCAESTYLKIDEQAAEQFEQLKKEIPIAKIVRWVGSNRNYLKGNAHKISVRDARLINQYSKRSIFEITEDRLLEFKVTDSARKILETISETHKLSKSSKDLNYSHGFLHKIKSGRTSSIPIEKAKRIEKFFEKNVFDIPQIFLRACTENINEGEVQSLMKPSLSTFIAFDKESINKAEFLPPDIKKKIEKINKKALNHDRAEISIRKAFLSNKISGSEIYNLSVENLETVPFPNEARDQLNELIQEKNKDPDFFQSKLAEDLNMNNSELFKLKYGIQKKIQFTSAKKINNYFGICLFDFEKILNDAKLDAADFYETSLQQTRKIKPLATDAQRKGKRKKTENTKPPVNKNKVNQSMSREESKSTQKQNPHPINDTMSNIAPSYSFSDLEHNLLLFEEQQQFTTPLNTQARPPKKRKIETNTATIAKRQKVDTHTTQDETMHFQKQEPHPTETQQTDYGMSNSPLFSSSFSDPDSDLISFDDQQQLYYLDSSDTFLSTTFFSTDDSALGAISHDGNIPTYKNTFGSAPLFTTASQSSPTEGASKATDSEFKFFI